jgi:formylmethanofuran dehydrogenase subunit E
MCYIPDYLDQWSEHDRQQEEALEKLPECNYCGEKIQGDYCFEINDEIICEKCLKDNFRKSTEDLMM